MWNQLKTIFLLGTLSALFIAMGTYLGGQEGMKVALIMAFIMNFFAYFFSDKMVLSMYGAQPLSREHYHWIYEMVGELAHEMQIPMPKLWLIKTPMANAFATGRNPSHASVAVTTGILSILDHDELRGVLAHELAHVKNRDILIGTVAAVIATAIGYVANMAYYAGLYHTSRNDKERKNPIGLLLMAMLLPMAATLIRLAISRSREYQADESGAFACKEPLALASALKKLQNHIPSAHLDNNDTGKASTASLFIVYPFSGNGWLSLFATHPPMAQRIQRLEEIARKNF